MGSGCTKCCGKIQDWCRDSCGCCPCKCCKTVQPEIKIQKTIEHKIERKEIPFGHGVLHSGIRTKDNTYTSPVLEVNTWRESRMQTTMNEASLTQTVALGGMQTERNNADHYLGPSRGAARRRLEIDEETIMIPVESIISMKYSSEIKKGHTEFQRVVLEGPQNVRLSCCQKITGWCNKTFCCCCDNSDRRIHTKPEQVVTTISGEEAQRRILITIEYIRYSNIHTPSHVRVLSALDQATFYKENLHTDILQFYLLDNCDFEQTAFDLKRMQASVLCRMVTQLKAMIGNYPDESILQTIISKHSTLAIGDPPKENLERLVGPGQVSTSMEVSVPFPAIKNRP